MTGAVSRLLTPSQRRRSAAGAGRALPRKVTGGGGGGPRGRGRGRLGGGTLRGRRTGLCPTVRGAGPAAGTYSAVVYQATAGDETRSTATGVRHSPGRLRGELVPTHMICRSISKGHTAPHAHPERRAQVTMNPHVVPLQAVSHCPRDCVGGFSTAVSDRAKQNGGRGVGEEETPISHHRLLISHTGSQIR